MEKIADIIESIANEKNLPLENVKEKVIKALTNTAKKYMEKIMIFLSILRIYNFIKKLPLLMTMMKDCKMKTMKVLFL